MTYAQLLETAHKAKGTVLQTVTGKDFTVGVYLDCPFFIPVSSGLGRSDGRKAAEKFLEQYNRTGSLTPADYQDVTRNASYFVILVQQK